MNSCDRAFAQFAAVGFALLDAIDGHHQQHTKGELRLPTTKRYRALVSWVHRKWGPQSQKLAAEGSSIRRALNSALLAFFKDKSKRQERLDAHAHVRVEIWRLKRE